jgi:Glycosyl hydrolase family 1
LPQALQDGGGWESADSAKAFADYVGYVGKLGDRIRHFFTLNEIRTFVELSYGTGQFAPGLTLPAARLNQARHHAVARPWSCRAGDPRRRQAGQLDLPRISPPLFWSLRRWIILRRLNVRHANSIPVV